MGALHHPSAGSPFPSRESADVDFLPLRVPLAQENGRVYHRYVRVRLREVSRLLPCPHFYIRGEEPEMVRPLHYRGVKLPRGFPLAQVVKRIDEPERAYGERAPGFPEIVAYGVALHEPVLPP